MNNTEKNNIHNQEKRSRWNTHKKGNTTNKQNHKPQKHNTLKETKDNNQKTQQTGPWGSNLSHLSCLGEPILRFRPPGHVLPRVTCCSSWHTLFLVAHNVPRLHVLFVVYVALPPHVSHAQLPLQASPGFTNLV